MPITDRTRKILWARSGNRCALCRAHLVHAASAIDRESVVGDECHIIAQSGDGPRGADLAADGVDELANLILLCKTDHKRVDDQRATYTAQVLRDTRTAHEAWIDAALSVAAEPAAREIDAVEALEQRLLRVEFLQESVLPPRYLLLAVDLLRPLRPADLHHFRALLVLRRPDVVEPRMLCLGGRDSYVTYQFNEVATVMFGHLILAWTEEPCALRQSTSLSEGFTAVPQLIFETSVRDVPAFATLHDLPALDASVYVTAPLWDVTSRVSIIASDYVVSSFSRSELAAGSGDPLVTWPDDLSEEERAVKWVPLLPKGPDYAQFEREGGTIDWFPHQLYQPWLLDTWSETPQRIRRRSPTA